MASLTWLRPWLSSHPGITRHESRIWLAVESLEGRDVPSTLSITDVTAREGPTSTGILDPAGAASVGIKGIRELTFRSNGDLFVTGWISQSVARFDWVSQTYQPFVTHGGGGMIDVQGISIGPDGNVYVSSPTQNIIFRFDGSTGVPLPAAGRPGAIFVADDPNTTSIDESGGLADARGITFGADGNLYVCSRNTNQILRFQGPAGSTPGAFLGVFASITNSSQPHDLSFGPDGNLYVSCINGGVSVYGQINRYDGLNGAPIGTGVFVAPGSGGLTPARQFVFDPLGTNLYVNISEANGITQLMRYQGPNSQNPGAFVEAYITAGQAGIDTGVGVALDSAGNFYMEDKNSGMVKRFAPTSQAQFTVTLDAASTSQASVNYATANGTALADTDYTPTSGALTFAPGETSKTVYVPITTVMTGGPTKTFTLNLSAVSGATIADGQGVGSILNRRTKFFVVDGTSGSPRTYEYGSGGTSEEITTGRSTYTAPRGVATTAAGTTVWVVDASKTVYVYNNGGTILGSWAAGGLPTNAQLEGLATNGTDVWLVDAGGDKVYRYANAAGRLSGSQAAASSFKLTGADANAKGIVTDGTSLWTVDDGASVDTVFKYTLGGGLLGSWTIDTGNAHPTGVTLNPAAPSDMWVVDNGSLKVYQYAAAVGRTSGSQAAAATFALAPGNTNPQDIADPPAGPADPTPLAVGAATDWAAAHPAAVLHGPFVGTAAGQPRPVTGPTPEHHGGPTAASPRAPAPLPTGAPGGRLAADRVAADDAGLVPAAGTHARVGPRRF